MNKCIAGALDYIKKKAVNIDINDKLDEIKALLEEKNIIPKKEVPKKTNPIVIVLAVIGAVATVAAIAYAVYYYFFMPEDSEDFEDFDEDDFDDDLDGDD